MLFNDTSAQFRPFNVHEISPIKQVNHLPAKFYGILAKERSARIHIQCQFSYQGILIVQIYIVSFTTMNFDQIISGDFDPMIIWNMLKWHTINGNEKKTETKYLPSSSVWYKSPN